MWKGRDAVIGIGNAADTSPRVRARCDVDSARSARGPERGCTQVARRGGRSSCAGCPGTSQRHVGRPARSTRSAWTTRWSPEVGPADTTPVAWWPRCPDSRGRSRQVSTGNEDAASAVRGLRIARPVRRAVLRRSARQPRRCHRGGQRQPRRRRGGHLVRSRRAAADELPGTGRAPMQPGVRLGSATTAVQLDRRLPPLASTRAIGSATAARAAADSGPRSRKNVDRALDR